MAASTRVVQVANPPFPILLCQWPKKRVHLEMSHIQVSCASHHSEHNTVNTGKPLILPRKARAAHVNVKAAARARQVARRLLKMDMPTSTIVPRLCPCCTSVSAAAFRLPREAGIKQAGFHLPSQEEQRVCEVLALLLRLTFMLSGLFAVPTVNVPLKNVAQVWADPEKGAGLLGKTCERRHAESQDRAEECGDLGGGPSTLC
ncbi:hypothetical protein AOLI_G00001360 [Acnodon oligacanthus]